MMSKFKVKAILDGVSKSLELHRGRELDLNSLKTDLERLFDERDLVLKYKSSDGRTEALYQNFHLEGALKDSEKSGAKYVILHLSGGSGKSHSPASVSSAPTITNRPASNSFSKTPSSSSLTTQPASSPTKPKFCENCGTPLPTAAKFCSSCGAVTVATPTSPRAAAAAPTSPRGSGEEICFGCKRSVSAGVRALDHLWHKECFSCKQCKKSLLEGSFVPGDDGYPLCGDCYDERFGKKCAKCSRPISGVFVNIEGKDYHKECFVCNNCQSSFDGGYFMKDGKPLCKNCV